MGTSVTSDSESPTGCEDAVEPNEEEGEVKEEIGSTPTPASGIGELKKCQQIVSRQVVERIQPISSNSSVILGYNDPPLGVDGNLSTSAKFVSDERGFWYQVHLDGVHCVDSVVSVDPDIYSHAWTCGPGGCGGPCQGALCRRLTVTVLNSPVGLPDNCGDGVELLITAENNKLLGYDFFEIAEFVLFGRKLVERQPMLKEIPVQSAQQTLPLRDLSEELGLTTKRRFFADEISSWNVTLHLSEEHCIEELQSWKKGEITHSWSCSEGQCNTCQGEFCSNFTLSVTSQKTSDLPGNCGDTVHLFIDQINRKVMEFEFLGIAEIAVMGRPVSANSGQNFECIEFEERQKVTLVNLISADSSTILGYNDPPYGIDGNFSTSSKFIADEDSFWYRVFFDGVYCVDSVMSLDESIYTHAWHCNVEASCGAVCDGAMCKYVDVRILRGADAENVNLPLNCGDGAEISIPNEKNKILGYDFFEIAEVAVFGRQIVVGRRLENEIPVQFASQTVKLHDLSAELGLAKKRRYLADEISSWTLTMTLDGLYCVDRLLSLSNDGEDVTNNDVITLSWTCSESECGICEGEACSLFTVSVINSDPKQGLTLGQNCGDFVLLSIKDMPDEEQERRVLGFGFLGASVIALTGKRVE